MGRKPKYKDKEEFLEALWNFLLENPEINTQGGLKRGGKKARSFDHFVNNHHNKEKFDFNSATEVWKWVEESLKKQNKFKSIKFRYQTLAESRLLYKDPNEFLEALGNHLLKNPDINTQGGLREGGEKAISFYNFVNYNHNNKKGFDFDSADKLWKWVEEEFQKRSEFKSIKFRYQTSAESQTIWTLETFTKNAIEYLNSEKSNKTRSGWEEYNNSAYAAARKHCKDNKIDFYDWCKNLGFIDGQGGYNQSKKGYFYILDAVTYLKVGISNVPEDRTNHLNKKHGSVTLFISKGYDGQFIYDLEREWLTKKDFKSSDNESFKIPFSEVDTSDEDGSTEAFEKRRDYVEGFLLFLLSKKVIDMDSCKKILMGVNNSKNLQSVFIKSCEVVEDKFLKQLNNKELSHIEIIGDKTIVTVFNQTKTDFRFVLEFKDFDKKDKTFFDLKFTTMDKKELDFFYDSIVIAKDVRLDKINEDQLEAILEACELYDEESEQGFKVYRNNEINLIVKHEGDKYYISVKSEFKSKKAQEKFLSILDEVVN